jgi:hypothetical protein
MDEIKILDKIEEMVNPLKPPVQTFDYTPLKFKSALILKYNILN